MCYVWRGGTGTYVVDVRVRDVLRHRLAGGDGDRSCADRKLVLVDCMNRTPTQFAHPTPSSSCKVCDSRV